MPPEHSETLDEKYGRKSELAALLPFCLKPQEITDLLLQDGTRYRPVKNIDTGGMKRVEVIHDNIIDRDIARAFLNEDKSWLQEKFLQEARLTAQLDHPNIVPVYEIGCNEHGKPYFTMKWLQGETLAAILKKLKDSDENYRKKYQRNYLIDLFQRVCEAVAFAHAKGVVHLDMKPANIVISEFGEVHVIDWGMARYFAMPPSLTGSTPAEAKDIEPDITHDGLVRGTPGYMSPEQAAGNVKQMDSKTDVYSLGAILYSILTYRPPIYGKDVNNILADTLAGKVTPPRERCPDLGIPESLEAVVIKAMQRAPEHRYESVPDLLNDIARYREGFATSAESAGSLKILGLLIRRNRTFCTVAGAAALVIIAMTLAFVNSLRNSERKAVRSADMLEQEVTKSRKLSYLASKQYLTQAKESFGQRYDFANAIPLAKMAVDLNPRNREALIFYAFLELGRQNFGEARLAFSKAGYKDSPELMHLLNLEQQQSDPSAGYISSLLETYQRMQGKTRASEEFLFFCMNLRRHMLPRSAMTAMFNHFNTNTTAGAILVTPTSNGTRAELGAMAADSAWSILLLSVTELKLTGTANSTFLLPYMPYLQALDLSNLQLAHLDPNLFNNSYAMHDLNIDGTALRSLSSDILRDNLERLSIRNCPLFDITTLPAFTKLKQVRISSGSQASLNIETIDALKRKGVEVAIQP